MKFTLPIATLCMQNSAKSVILKSVPHIPIHNPHLVQIQDTMYEKKARCSTFRVCQKFPEISQNATPQLGQLKKLLLMLGILPLPYLSTEQS